MFRQRAAALDGVEPADLEDRLRPVSAAGGQVMAGAAAVLVEERSQAVFGSERPVEERFTGCERFEFRLAQARKRETGFRLGVR